MNKYRLSSVIDIISGGTPKTSVPEYWNGDIGWLSVVDFGDKNKYVYDSEKTITDLGVVNSSTKVLAKDDIIISARGTVGALAMLAKPMAFNQSCFGLRAKEDLVNQHYLFYCLKNYISNIKKRSQGSVFETINLATFDNLEIEIPPLNIQNSVADLLSSLDSKIELNNKIISELESMAKTLYDYWFLQFDFPDENGKPYKSSGGKMVWNEELKREIPEGWEVTNIGNLMTVVTGKEDANFSLPNGKYKFFTCSQETLLCDTPAFSGQAVLIAGNGDFNVKHYSGEFNAYQRTYVLIPENQVYYGATYISSKNQIQAFKNGSNGSIVKFITKGDVENIPFILPNDDSIFHQINKLIEKIELCERENEELTKLRDFLLPMLMNGQVTFKESK